MKDLILSLDGLRVFVAGHRGMVGAAIVRRLQSEGCEISTVDRRVLDLRDQAATLAFLRENRPDVVVVAAAKVGGILANDSFPVEFLADNLAIAQNLIEGSYKAQARKLLFLGSSCVYPKLAPQPITEDSLLTGPLEPTNQWYAVAKIAAIKLCEAFRRQHGADFIAAMPTNLYGPGDNYHPEHSHVPAALIRRFHEAKLAHATSVAIWGSGTPLREFMHVDDLADACVFLLKHYSGDSIVNIGGGEEFSISEFARLIAKTVGYAGPLTYDPSRPDGTPRKLLDSSRLRALGWAPKINIEAGLAATYADFLAMNTAAAYDGSAAERPR
ncbi:GDP-L-fucose synthase [Xanthobacteraceae bacterium Astr-EGSB]|uniref:GDP-L-fucose synthase family protein n=1 Tax=Astrobacterium formosum TaxID=3069710 RepID=UPI0027AEB9BF|nr:GDP-L-fucose synthase [Xanthobacteraceae bacterium Astr-EGSB]